MQQQTSLYIPKPCHEDWSKMTPSQQGKFCTACSKQVIDFSLMSDNQVLNYLSSQSGKVCGRFDAEQLQRHLVETKIKKKKSWWMALTMPLLFLFDRSEAQNNKVVGDAIYNTVPKKEMNEMILGKVAIDKPGTNICKPKQQLSGKITDENNNPLAYASVFVKGTIYGTVTDSTGNFSLNIQSYNNSAVLVASYVGYATIEKPISLKEEYINITMQLEPASMGEVVVTGYTVHQQLTGTVGGLIVCRKVTRAERIDSVVCKSFKIAAFNVYPNPVMQNSLVRLEIKQAGEYQLQLLDNQSRLMSVENINTSGNKTVSNFSLPSNIAAGIYYLRLINEKTKKYYTEKLIIQ